VRAARGEAEEASTRAEQVLRGASARSEERVSGIEDSLAALQGGVDSAIRRCDEAAGRAATAQAKAERAEADAVAKEAEAEAVCRKVREQAAGLRGRALAWEERAREQMASLRNAIRRSDRQAEAASELEDVLHAREQEAKQKEDQLAGREAALERSVREHDAHSRESASVMQAEVRLWKQEAESAVASREEAVSALQREGDMRESAEARQRAAEESLRELRASSGAEIIRLRGSLVAAEEAADAGAVSLSTAEASRDALEQEGKMQAEALAEAVAAWLHAVANNSGTAAGTDAGTAAGTDAGTAAGTDAGTGGMHIGRDENG